MAVFYTPPNADSSVGVPWALLQNGHLTPTARLVLIYALAQVPTWTATAEVIGKELGFDRKRVMTAINQLIEFGYARKVSIGAGRGRPPRHGWDFAWPEFPQVTAKVPKPDSGGLFPKSQNRTLDEDPQVTAKVPMSDFGGFVQSPKTGLRNLPKSGFGTRAYIEEVDSEERTPSVDQHMNQEESRFSPPAPEETVPMINFNDVELPPSRPKPRSSKSTEDPDFDRAWELYDNKKSKADAQRAWKKAVKKVGAEKILAAIPPYVASTPDKKFRAHMATWLNGERWNDEIEPPKRGYQGKAGSDAKEGHVYVDNARKRSVPLLIRSGVVPSEEMGLAAYYHWHHDEQADWTLARIQEAGNTAAQARWLFDAYRDGPDADLYRRFLDYFSLTSDAKDDA